MSSQPTNINTTTTHYCPTCKVHFTNAQSYLDNGVIKHAGWCMDKSDYNRMVSNNGRK